ncbi:MAG TPA: hypothetical protein VJ372_18290 [Pyrinomonadaceae bacterium]|jgi:hypothetical protein|nr:hypothetical protein [Pyrinomonadaceae bacterium]
MSAPIRRPIASDTSSYLDSFDEFEHEHTTGNSSAKTLKPPPEIWELVHPVSEEHFKPGDALVSRLAKKNLFMVVVAILLTSGVSLAGWKFHIPQKVAAVFAEPDVPGKKSSPMTVRRTTVDTTKPIPSSAATMTNAAVIQPTAQGVNNNVAQPSSTASKSAVRKSSKSGIRVASVATAATTSITTTSVQPSAATKPKALLGTGESSAVSSENKNAVNATDTAAKSKPNPAASPQLVAPVKPTPAPKPKVIQWP